MLLKKYYFYAWKQRSFYTKSYLLNQDKFNDKSEWFKQFKIKQAEMQKDDGVPVFLKKGLPDKILYNITLGSVLIMTFICIKSLCESDARKK